MGSRYWAESPTTTDLPFLNSVKSWKALLRLPDDCQTIVSQLPHDCLMTDLWLPYNHKIISLMSITYSWKLTKCIDNKTRQQNNGHMRLPAAARILKPFYLFTYLIKAGNSTILRTLIYPLASLVGVFFGGFLLNVRVHCKKGHTNLDLGSLGTQKFVMIWWSCHSLNVSTLQIGFDVGIVFEFQTVGLWRHRRHLCHLCSGHTGRVPNKHVWCE